MPTQLTSMIARFRKSGKSAKEAEKLAVKEYNARFLGKAVGLKGKKKKGKR